MNDNTQQQSRLSFLGNTLGVNANALNTLNAASQTIAQIGERQSKSVSDFTQVLARDKLARASQLQQQPNPFAQLGRGMVEATANYLEQKERKALEGVQESEEKARQLAREAREARELDLEKQKAELNVFYEETLRNYTKEGLFAKEGGQGFINRITNEIERRPNLPPDAASNILSRAYRTVLEYEQAETAQANKLASELQEKVAENKATFYQARAVFITERLRHGTTREQSAAFEDQYREQVIAPLFADPSLTDIQKHAIAAKLNESFIAALKNKVSNYEEVQSAFRQWNQAQPLYQRAYLRFAQTGDQVALAADLAAIHKEFPLSKDFTLPPGEAMRRTNEMLRTQLENAKLTQEEREAYPLQLQPQSIRHFAAQAILDRSQLPRIREELQNEDTYKLIERIVDEWDKYNSSRADLDVERARINTEISQLNLSSAEDFYKLAIQATKSNDAGASTLLSQALALATNLTEEQKQLLLSNPEQARNNAEVQRLIRQFTIEKQAALQQLVATKRNELMAKSNALSAKFPNLTNFGLFGADTRALRNAVEVGRASAKADIENYRNRLLQIRRNNSLNQSFNGQIPNFKQDSNRDTPLTNPGVLGRVRVRQSNGELVDVLSPLGNNGNRSGVFTSPFGPRWGRMHAGIDIAAPRGTPVHSVTSGTVYATYPIDGYGNIVTVLGDDGLFYRYAHAKPVVNKGDRVVSGQHIATIDGSGRGTGDHLHFEVRTAYARGGSAYAIDPVPHLIKLAEGVRKGSTAKDVRQDTDSMIRGNVSTNSPVVISGRGTVVTGNSVTNIFPNVQRPLNEASTIRLQPTRQYNLVQSQFTRNRPVTRAQTSPLATTTRNDPEANYNYVYLAQNPTFRRELARVADRLGMSAKHLADIMFQESKFTPNLLHGAGSNVGLIGTGRDSGSGDINTVVRMSAVEQLHKVVAPYIERNIPPQHRKNIITLWAGIRMGTRLRNRVWADPSSAYKLRMNDSGVTYGEELKRLGREAGREYLIPGMDRRSSSLKPNYQVAYGWGKSTLDAQLGVQTENHMQMFIGDA